LFGDGGSGFRFVVTRLAVAVILIGGLVWWLSPGSGEEEFLESQNALRKAASWRMRVSYGTAEQDHTTLAEFACPARVHVQRQVLFKDGHEPFHLEEITIDLLRYSRFSSGEWQKHAGETGEFGYVCRAMQQGLDSEPMPPLNLFLKRGVIRKKDMEDVNGQRCREWSVQVAEAPGQLRTESICIHPSDHLPRRRITADVQYFYSDWNTVIRINSPIQD
jgi:hypothetical protein